MGIVLRTIEDVFAAQVTLPGPTTTVLTALPSGGVDSQNDLFPVYDASASEWRTTTLSNMRPSTETLTVADNDSLYILPASGTMVRTTWGNIKSTISLSDLSGTLADITANLSDLGDVSASSPDGRVRAYL